MVNSGEKMFIGEYITSVTTGNRIAIPKPLRQQLKGAEIILTRGYEGCMVLVDEASFDKLLEGIANVPFISADKREVSRFLLSGAHSVSIDGQGRVVLPESLLRYASVKSEQVAVLGVGSWVEIWDEHEWLKYQEKMNKQSQTIADRLMSLQRTP